MVKLAAGDILKSSSQFIAHAMAPEEDFSRGLAKALRDKWPKIAEDFRRYRAKHPVHPGSVWVWKSPTGQQVIGLITHELAQGRKAGKATAAYVDHTLVALRRLVQRRRAKSLALSRLATGSGGLKWSDVETFIHQQLMDLKIPVTLYDRHRRGVKVKE
jgi:O-acetyl-ADP-ribose deacetylase (regulator of RNase III)